MAQHRGGGLITTESYESLISQLAAANERIEELMQRVGQLESERHEFAVEYMRRRLKAEARINQLEAALRKIEKFSGGLDPDDNARQCGHYVASVASTALRVPT